MMYTEDQVKAMLAKSDELHKHTEDHLMGIIRKYQSDLAIAVEALDFYAKGKTNSNEATHGERMEFGCGCCAGVYDSENGTDYDGDVIGQTAREALAKIRGEG